MKRCPSCEGTRHYKLADGRLKCRGCGQRFSWTSVWDSVRLPVATKQRLLELFVLGVPSYRQRFRSDASAAARERFYRLLRRRRSSSGSRSRAPLNATKPRSEALATGLAAGVPWAR